MKTKIVKIDPNKIDEDIIKEAADFIKMGKNVVFPTETVYGLGGDTFNKNAVANIFKAKGRPMDNPLISHISCISQVEMLAREIPSAAIDLMHEFWGGPLTIILKKRSEIPDEVTAGLDTVAIRMPSHSVANALISASNTPIAAPSANISGHPSPTTAQHCIDDLDGKVDMIIDGGQSVIGLESTVLDLTVGTPVILRPGAISREDIINVIGECEYGASSSNAPKAPGMKYTHYSPKAQVHALPNINEVNKMIKYSDKKVCVIALNASKIKFDTDLVYDAGKDNSDYAARLFYFLRKADDDKADIVFAQLPTDDGIGRAVSNRLLKAAGGSVINYEDFVRLHR